jgi:DNA-directed RNA polymerase specialized sigma24 family protein
VHAQERPAAFREFVLDAEVRLRRALVSTYGPDRGREATCEALAYAWEHWETVRELANPVGYLYRVGQSRTRQRRRPVLFDRPVDWEPVVEPALAGAVSALPERQRVAVILVHGAGWTLAEVGDLLSVRPSTVQRHVDRALAKLRRAIEGRDCGRAHDWAPAAPADRRRGRPGQP